MRILPNPGTGRGVGGGAPGLPAGGGGAGGPERTPAPTGLARHLPVGPASLPKPQADGGERVPSKVSPLRPWALWGQGAGGVSGPHPGQRPVEGTWARLPGMGWGALDSGSDLHSFTPAFPPFPSPSLRTP